ncbi:hypothetical protein G6F31_015633 [Rhizopus arrhizus]|nr:hypothetical protein G6F31_015633 [Rhizopus arrhizus]
MCGRPRVVDQERAAVAVGVARAQRRQAAAGAGDAAHRVERAAVTPIAGHALPGDQAVVGKMLALGLGDAEACSATIAIDEWPEPQPVFVAGGVADGHCQRAQAVAGRYVTGLRSRCGKGDGREQKAGRQEHPAHARLLWGMAAASQCRRERRV